MTLHPGRHQFGADRGRILIYTKRDGLAAQAGHDLTIGATRWSGELTIGEDSVPTGLSVRIDMTALAVRDGTGGLKPLTDSDRREIAVTARKVLGANRHPEAVFTGTKFEPAAPGGGVITGDLTMAGVTRPLRLQVSQAGAGAYRATGSIVQSEFGIKPYTGFFGALRVRDAVGVEVQLDLADAADASEPTEAQP